MAFATSDIFNETVIEAQGEQGFQKERFTASRIVTSPMVSRAMTEAGWRPCLTQEVIFDYQQSKKVGSGFLLVGL